MADEPERDSALIRARVNQLLDSAFADDGQFRESFLRAEAANQSQALAEALRSGRPEALRRLAIVIEEFLWKQGRRSPPPSGAQARNPSED
jgi:hypothetical protein